MNEYVVIFDNRKGDIISETFYDNWSFSELHDILNKSSFVNLGGVLYNTSNILSVELVNEKKD